MLNNLSSTASGTFEYRYKGIVRRIHVSLMSTRLYSRDNWIVELTLFANRCIQKEICFPVYAVYSLSLIEITLHDSVFDSDYGCEFILRSNKCDS